MLPTKIYSFAIPAGGMFELPVLGEFFKVLSASGTFTAASDTYGVVGALLPGQGVKDAPFNKLQFVDTSGFPNNLKVLVAAASFIDDRITGEVSVVDGNLARTGANQAFMTTASINPVTAANNGGVQIWNAAASKANVVIDRVRCVASATCGFNLRLNQVQLATAVGAAISKLGGGAASASASLKTGEGTVWVGPSMVSLGSPVANQDCIFESKTPIVVPPGWGLTVSDTLAVAHTSTVCFEHVELLIQ